MGCDFLLYSITIASLISCPADVEVHHLETARPLVFSNVSVVSQGPLRAAVRAEIKYDKSTIAVTVSSASFDSISFSSDS